MTKSIIVARYDEDINWLSQLTKDHTIYIYNKGKNNIECYKQINNIGREGYAYLTHIINHYDCLEDHNFFLQGDATNHCYNIYDSINNFDYSVNNYKGISGPIFQVTGVNVPVHMYNDSRINETNRNEISPKFLFKEILGKNFEPFENIIYNFHACGCFYVNKENILKHSLNSYKEILQLIEKYEILYEYLLEYSWHFIFDSIYNMA